MRTIFIDMDKFRGRHIDVMHNGKKIGFARVDPDGIHVVLEDDRFRRSIINNNALAFSVDVVESCCDCVSEHRDCRKCNTKECDK